MPRAQAGAYDRRLEIQQPLASKVPGGMGDEIVTWIPYARPWAFRRVPRGTERLQGQQAQAEVDAVFELRHSVAGLTPMMRIVDGADVYDITAILAAERLEAGPELHARRAVTE